MSGILVYIFFGFLLALVYGLLLRRVASVFGMNFWVSISGAAVALACFGLFLELGKSMLGIDNFVVRICPLFMFAVTHLIVVARSGGNVE